MGPETAPPTGSAPANGSSPAAGGEESPRRGWTVVGVCAAVLFYSAGLRFSYSIFVVPITEAFGWSPLVTSGAYSLNMILWGLTQPLAGGLADRYGGRPVMATGAVLMSLAYLWLSRIGSAWEFYATFGVLASLGFSAVSATVVASIVNRWFRQKRGLATGIPIAGWSLGQLTLAPLIAWALVGLPGGWRTTLGLFGVGFALLLLPMVLVGVRQVPPAGGDGRVAGTAGGHRMGLGTALRSPLYWAVLIPYFSCGFSDFFLNAHFTLIAGERGITVPEAAVALSAMAGANMVGTLLAGHSADRYGASLVLVFTYGVRAVALLFLIFAVQHAVGFAAFASVFGLTGLATIPVTSSLVGDVFGRASVGLLYGVASTVHHLGGALGSLAGGWVYTRTGSGLPGLWLTFSLVVLATLLSLALTITLARRRPAAAELSRAWPGRA